MASIRAVVMEMSGTDAMVLDAIRAFVGTDGHQVVTVAALPTAAAAAPAKAIEAARDETAGKLKHAPPKRRSPVKREKPVHTDEPPMNFGKAEPEDVKKGHAAPGGTPNCRTQVFERLKSRAMTSQELIKAFPKYTPGAIYLALKELRAAMVVKTHMIDGEQQNERVG